MKINIRARNMDLTEALKEHTEKKLQKLDRFFDHIQEISIEFHLESVANAEARQIAQATVFASGTVIRAEESSEKIYHSVDTLIDKLEVQLKKYKEKLRDNKRGSATKRSLKSGKASSVSKLHHEEKRLYRPKPMSTEEAAEQLLLEKLPFLVFRNSTTEKINVVYPIRGSEIGLIEP